MISYKVISRKNPQDSTAPPKYYLSPVANGNIDLDGLAALISDGSTVRQADVYAVLVGMVNAISQQLAEGKRVRLGKLGTFSIGLHSEGVEKEEEAGAQLIKRSKINYRPGVELQDMLKTLNYRKTK
jgi:predicted histone-like DNA-binding protein